MQVKLAEMVTPRYFTDLTGIDSMVIHRDLEGERLHRAS